MKLVTTRKFPAPHYHLDVYPYVSGAQETVVDFGRGQVTTGPTVAKAVGGNHITVGNNGDAIERATKALKASGIPILNNFWNPEGITYTGLGPAVEVRFAVTDQPEDPVKEENPTAVVVVYRQRLSDHVMTWSRAYPIKVSPLLRSIPGARIDNSLGPP